MYIPVHSWWSPSRYDNFATTDVRWRGTSDAERSPDYRFVREEGFLISPDEEQPPDTSIVYSWYSPTRADNFLTTDPRWSGLPGDTKSPDYRFVRREGYIFRDQLTGTVPLVSYYSRSRGDNFCTSDPRWVDDIGAERSPDYRLYRVEGYLRPSATYQRPDVPEAFGYSQSLVGDRKVIVALVDFPDVPFVNGIDYFKSLFDTASDENLSRYFGLLSGGRFRPSLEVVDPITSPIPSTGDLSNFDRQILQVLGSGPVDFQRYDTDDDGVIGANDISLVFINANYRPEVRGGAQTRSISGSLRLGGVELRNMVGSFCDEFAGMNTIGHELIHQWHPRESDIYGPGASLNWRASLMAGSPVAPDNSPIQLDPWHSMTAGWLRPTIRPMQSAGAVSHLHASAAGFHQPERSPAILYDPSRGRSEYFFVEFRSRVGNPATDAGGKPEPGLAVWHVAMSPAGGLLPIDWTTRRPVTPARQNMFANYYLSRGGDARGPYLRDEDGEIQLRWLDGTDSGYRVAVRNVTGHTAVYEWWRVGSPLKPRLDAVIPPEVPAGAYTRIDGEIPVRGSGYSVIFQNRVARVEGEVLSVSMSRVVVRVPDGIRAGRYRIGLRYVRDGTVVPSNQLLLTVS